MPGSRRIAIANLIDPMSAPIDKPAMLPRSSISGMVWPSIPEQSAATLLAMQFQFEQSQWWHPALLRQHQLRQVARLLAHASDAVPFYRGRLGAAGGDPVKDGVTEASWASLPFLAREDIQHHGHALRSLRPPPDHGQVVDSATSGSTGRPIRFCGTEVTRFFWRALTLRDHLWQRRDLSGTLAAIRTTVNEGETNGWGPATDAVFATGPCVTMNIRSDVETQVEWLQRQNPDYLLSHPSNILALARRCIETGVRLPRLRELRTFGETLMPGLREACRLAWDARVTDVYSAEEVGYIALQCPEGEHYHIQAENLLVEILGDDGRPCAPGEIGRVVVTTLNNFAMPLIRYQIGDYAELGEPCRCGRGLPVLKRILGRQRNMLTLPDGRQHWPSFPAEGWLPVAPVRQFQLVQRDLERIEARFVADRPLTADELRRLEAMLHEYLRYAFKIDFVQLERIERKPNCKFEDFISELPA